MRQQRQQRQERCRRGETVGKTDDEAVAELCSAPIADEGDGCVFHARLSHERREGSHGPKLLRLRRRAGEGGGGRAEGDDDQ